MYNQRVNNLEEYLQLAGIQHFSFCRRQWALIHIEKVWEDNYLTSEGRLMHERVHDRTVVEKRGDELVVRGLPIKCDRLQVSGECDAVVFEKNAEGVALSGREGLWQPMPVEYKHGHSKCDNCDRLQLTAQVLCLEEMFSCEIKKGALYYQETHSREYVDISYELRCEVEKLFEEMHDMFVRGYTPKVTTQEKCIRCSLKEHCLPEIFGEGKNVARYMNEHIEEIKP